MDPGSTRPADSGAVLNEGGDRRGTDIGTLDEVGRDVGVAEVDHMPVESCGAELGKAEARAGKIQKSGMHHASVA